MLPGLTTLYFLLEMYRPGRRCGRHVDWLPLCLMNVADMVWHQISRGANRPLRGKHSRATRRACFREAADTIDVQLTAGRVVQLYLEVQYTHLGSVLHRDGSLLPEARLQLGIAASAFKKYGRMLLLNKSISLAIRLQLFDSLVGGVFFNLPLWTPCCKGWNHLYNGYSLLVGRLLRDGSKDQDFEHVRCQDMAAILGVPDFDIVCRMRRFGFLATVLSVGDSDVWAIIRLECRWARQVCDGLRWFWQYAQTPLPASNGQSWEEWRLFISITPTAALSKKFDKPDYELVSRTASKGWLEGL